MQLGTLLKTRVTIINIIQRFLDLSRERLGLDLLLSLSLDPSEDEDRCLLDFLCFRFDLDLDSDRRFSLRCDGLRDRDLEDLQ